MLLILMALTVFSHGSMIRQSVFVGFNFTIIFNESL